MYYDRLSDLGIKLTRHAGSEKTRCPQCSDARKNKHDKPLSVDINTGSFNCHNCGYKGNVRTIQRRDDQKKKYEKPDQNLLKSRVLGEKVAKYFKDRGVSEKTLQHFMVFGKEEFMPQSAKNENCICFPYLRDGLVVNIKYRSAQKHFKLVKDAELIFYNMPSLSGKTKAIIVEGEIDCLSVYEVGYGQLFPNKIIEADKATGEVLKEETNPFSQWAVISVPNGASKGNQRLDYIDNCSDWLFDLNEIVIATDGDEAGIMLKNELIRRFGVEKCRILSYPIEEVVNLDGGIRRRCKDLNEVLVHLGKDAVKRCIEDAQFIPVDGIYEVDDIFPTMLKNFKSGIQLAPTTRFKDLDEYFRWKKGDITLCTGYGNHGKSFFMLQLMLTKSIWDGWKWAIFSPENYPANDFYDDLIEMYVGKFLTHMSVDEYTDAAKFIDKHIFYVYPEHEHDILSIHEKFRYLVMKKGVDGVMVDPFNQLDHTQKSFEREDQYLSGLLKDIKRFALLNNICYCIVAHPKNPSYKQEDKSLPIVDMYDIAGGAVWGNKCDQILSYYRPNFHVDKNSPEVQVYVQKLKRKRTGGKLGHMDMTLIWSKKRYTEALSRETPCDPKLLFQDAAQQTMYAPQKMWKPYLDNVDDIGF